MYEISGEFRRVGEMLRLPEIVRDMDYKGLHETTYIGGLRDCIGQGLRLLKLEKMS
jgi:hypothetical protein